ncbi:MAG: cellulose biosynthesis cyclic di-GMP-binding regulatory protein BcsB [Pseudomonadota bacterium]
MNRVIARSCAGLLGLSLLAGTAGPSWAATAMEERIDLNFDETDLRGGLDSIEAPIYLPPSASITSARLVLGYANALAVDPEGSDLRLSLNGDALADLPLVATQGLLSAEIEIPPGALRTGPNLLRLTSRPKHRLECTRSAFEELWTRVEPSASYLELRYAGSDDEPVLRDLGGVLAASRFDGEAVTVVTRRPVDDPMVLQWGGVLAEAVALRRGQRAVTVKSAVLGQRSAGGGRWLTSAEGHQLAVGTLNELRGLLPATLPEGAAHGLIAVRPLPGDSGRLGIVVSGATDTAVSRAAAHLRSPGTDWPASATLALAPGLADPVPGSKETVSLRPGTVPLATLGYGTHDLPVSYTETIDVPLHLPDDYYAGDGQRIELLLDFAYSAGLAPTSALIIRVNGAPWNMLRLDQPTGDMVEGARVELPMGLFHPGQNVIGFEPLLHLGEGANCALFDDQPMFSLFDGSEIRVPEFAHLARQPSLSLFASSAFPYGGAADSTRMLVGGRDAETVAAAWTLRGKLAQRRGEPLFGLTSSFESGATEQHLLVVAAKDALPDAFENAVPFGLNATAQRRVGVSPVEAAASGQPVARLAAGPGPGPAAAETEIERERWARRLVVGQDGQDNVLSAMTGWIVRMAGAVPVVGQSVTTSRERMAAFGEQEATGALVAFRSPFATDRTVTVVTAKDAANLGRAVNAMVQPAVWNQLGGDVSLLNPESGAVVHYSVAAPYVVGALDSSPSHLLLLWRTFMARHQGHWLLLVLGAIAALSLVTGLALRRIAR